MAEPKKTLEAALFSLLDGDAGITWSVYNGRAAGSAFEYVFLQATGGSDEWFHLKKQGYQYDYQVTGVHTDRSTALDMNAAIEAAMATATGMSVSGQSVVAVTRMEPVDYTQVLEDGRSIFFVGGLYRIELEEV